MTPLLVMQPAPFWHSPAVSNFRLSRHLAQIRADPVVNYCAWNEPRVPGWDGIAADTVRRSRREWPLIGLRQAAFSFIAFLYRRPAKPGAAAAIDRW